MSFKTSFCLKDHPVHTVKDYIELPRALRETNYGFYLVPFALAFNIDGFYPDRVTEWDKFYNYIKTEYPIQWFFRHYLTSWDNPITRQLKLIGMRLSDVKYGIKRFVKPLFPRWRKSCSRHEYTDVQELIVSSNFALILDFWYEEVLDSTVEWDSNDEHKQFYEELSTHVKYIETGKKALEDKSSKELSIASKKKGKKSYEERYGKYNKLEQELRNNDTHILSWFIENRRYFWT